MKRKVFYRSLFQKYLAGVAISLGLASGALLSVAITETVNSFSDGETLSAGKLNTNFTTLKTAFESIPSWTKSGNNSVFTGGNVGVGVSSPSNALDVNGTVNATNFIGTGAGLTGLAAQTSSGVVNADNVTLGADTKWRGSGK